VNSKLENLMAFTTDQNLKLDANECMQRFSVLTGGPGSGKSTLIAALQRAGYAHSIEAGRGIIQDQLAIGGRALPWIDPGAFAELMLSWEMRSYRMARTLLVLSFSTEVCRMWVGYLRLLNRPVPPHIQRAAQLFCYNHVAFIAPPWEGIFRQDRERKQDYSEAVRTYEAMASTTQRTDTN
jgi:predicted ATPase